METTIHHTTTPCKLYTEHTLVYTDGSRDTSNNRTASAYVVPSIRHKIIARLPNGCSVCTAELWAINQALHWIGTHNHTTYLIISDSLSALQTLTSKKKIHPEQPKRRNPPPTSPTAYAQKQTTAEPGNSEYSNGETTTAHLNSSSSSATNYNTNRAQTLSHMERIFNMPNNEKNFQNA
ncbi:hypothetical protein CHS0354_038555 [Potamilus streckersoni]|uniref:RNase H type-1 domain-containing protein n=1 Tax=Potamilus streckersoni TaxID=2493646 RepID=A0AAE0RS24_9BIVA|nr:hypothetical protein CHS0354_038555 [Potamilus streckersoni]